MIRVTSLAGHMIELTFDNRLRISIINIKYKLCIINIENFEIPNRL